MSTKPGAAPKKTISKQGAGQLSLRGFFAPKPAASTPSTKTESPLSPETDPKTTRPEAAPPAKTDTPLKLDQGLAAAPSPDANTSTPVTQPVATDQEMDRSEDADDEPSAKPAAPAKPVVPAKPVEPAAKRAAPASDEPSKKRAAPAAQPGKRRPVCIAESESDGDAEEEESGSDEDEEDYEDEDSDEDAPLSKKPPAKKQAAAKKPPAKSPASKQDAPKNPFAAKPATVSAGSSSAVGSDHAAEILAAACTANAANPRKVGRSAREDGGPAAEDEGPDGGKTVSYAFLRDKQDAQGRRPGEEGFDKSTLLVKLRKDERFTPGQQQYWDIKKGYADMVVFFKMGTPYQLEPVPPHGTPYPDTTPFTPIRHPANLTPPPHPYPSTTPLTPRPDHTPHLFLCTFSAPLTSQASSTSSSKRTRCCATASSTSPSWARERRTWASPSRRCASTRTSS